MSKLLVRQCDDAFNQFRELSEQLLREMGEHQALIADYDGIVERQVRAVNTGVAFLYEAAASITELTTGKTVSQILAEHDIHLPGGTLQ